MKKLIIAADLGRVRVLKYKEAGLDPIEQEHLLEEPTESAKEHVNSMSETVTSQAGRFGRGAAIGMETGMSYGEEHHLQDEIQREALIRIASRIDLILNQEGNPPWILAAPRSILLDIEEILHEPNQKNLTSTIGADLTRCPLREMEERFL